ncbi:MAG: hypothetical protein ABSH52_36245, partial [Terriglobia bacterium]
AVGWKSNPELPQPRRGGRYSSTVSVAPSGAVIMAVEPHPTAHAVGYFLPPLRGFHRPRTLRLTLMGQRPGFRTRPILLWEQALQGRNHQAMAAADRRLRRVEQLVTPLQGWRIARHRIFTQAVGLGFVRPPLWGLGTSPARWRGARHPIESPRLTSRITVTGD